MPSAADDPREAAGAGLALRLRAGAPDALGAWYAEEHPQVFRLCLAFLGDPTEAEDFAQDAMLHLSDRIARWDPSRPYRPWRTRVVLNLARDRRRRHASSRSGAPLPDLPARLPAPEEIAEQRELQRLVGAALAQLPEREREAFALHDLAGHDTAEVAEAMEIGASTVRSLLTLARRRLRELLAPRLMAAEPGGPHAG
jgi:RNA polymerase sigma factor (sigma-70 family)